MKDGLLPTGSTKNPRRPSQVLKKHNLMGVQCTGAKMYRLQVGFRCGSSLPLVALFTIHPSIHQSHLTLKKKSAVRTCVYRDHHE